ncbi:MAG TPA: DUF3224 domain-containing protein [Candidatus Eremiobacteraceae bacterium]|nr:DUF3224 domain-containing protein [Candidatus Eremiobacteraceae bacterium]
MRRKWIGVAAAICATIFGVAFTLAAQENKGTQTMTAKGPFEVKLIPVETAHKDEKGIARYSIDKVYHGDLEGNGVAEMLASLGEVKTSGTYVAIEVVRGTLAGKKGSFALGHIGTMQGGKQSLDIRVVPDSGTGELAGISGKMNILIAADGKHSYEFEYEIHK